MIEWRAIEANLAAIGRTNSSYQRHECRLARAVWAEETEEFTAFQRERDTLERGN